MKLTHKLIFLLIFITHLLLPHEMLAQQDRIWLTEIELAKPEDASDSSIIIDVLLFDASEDTLLGQTRLLTCGLIVTGDIETFRSGYRFDNFYSTKSSFLKPDSTILTFNEVADLDVYLEVLYTQSSLPPDISIGSSEVFPASELDSTLVMQFGNVHHLRIGTTTTRTPAPLSPLIKVTEIGVTGISDGIGRLEIEVHLHEEGTDRFLACSGQINGLEDVDHSGIFYNVNATFHRPYFGPDLTYQDIIDKNVYVVVIEDDGLACPCPPDYDFPYDDDRVATSDPFPGAELMVATEIRNIGGLEHLAIALEGVPERVMLIAPEDLSVLSGDLLEFEWQSSPNAEAYQFQLAMDSLFANTIVDSTVTDSNIVIPVAGLNNDFHWWRVRASNSIGSGLFSRKNRFVYFGPPTNPPATPTLISPTDRAEDQPTTLTLSWNASENATSYHLQVSTSADFSTTVVDESGLTTTSREVGPLTNNTVYYWRVSAQNSVGSSPFSGIWSFTTIVQLPSQVILISPTNDIVIETDSVQFSWQRSQPAVDRYWFEIATDASMANAVIDSTLMAADTVKVVRELLNMQTYWWRVRAGNAAGWGLFSEQRRFDVDIPTSVHADDQIPVDFSLSQNYPNPFNPSTTIEYTLPKSAEVTLKIYDVGGKEIVTLVRGQQTAGRHRVRFEATGLASGLYFYRLEAGDFVQTKKLTLLK